MLSPSIFLAFRCGTIGPDPRYDRRELAMERQGDEVHLNETEADRRRQGAGRPLCARLSLLLVVIAMSADLDHRLGPRLIHPTS
jgi:hypothetical protein